jgi:pimeloyl-ACP methyl ester carboxylesterase
VVGWLEWSHTGLVIETTVSVAGPIDGEPALLLHGFPMIRHGWSRQIGPLAEAGFRVIAIDPRGLGEAM